MKKTIGAALFYILGACAAPQVVVVEPVPYGNSVKDQLHQRVMAANPTPVTQFQGEMMTRRAWGVLPSSEDYCAEIRAKERFKKGRFHSATIDVRVCGYGEGRYIWDVTSPAMFDQLSSENIDGLPCICQPTSIGSRPLLDGIDPDFSLVYINHQGRASRDETILQRILGALR